MKYAHVLLTGTAAAAFFLLILSSAAADETAAAVPADIPAVAAPELDAPWPVSVFSVDTEFLLTGVANGGFGIGVRYERMFWPHLSLRGNFGHSVLLVENSSVWSPTVCFSLAAAWYPFDTTLRGLYAEFGSGFDYIGYQIDNQAGNVQTTFISVIPAVGCKLVISHWLLVDLSCGYKYIFTDENAVTYGDVTSWFHSGFQYGISCKWRIPPNEEIKLILEERKMRAAGLPAQNSREERDEQK